MPLLSRLRCAKLGRIIGVLLIAAALGACSAIKLAYNNLPEVSYWWLDDHFDFDDVQTPRVRDELAQLLAWHRRNELPKFVGLLQKAQGMAPGDLTPAQACELAGEVRMRLLAVAQHAEAASAELARSLSEMQLQQLERKYAKTNAAYRKDWLDRSPARQQEKRYDQWLDRSEDFYGRLEAAQRDLLQQQVAQSIFDPARIDSERRKRQQETLALLRGLSHQKTPPPEARAAIHAYVQRIAEPPPGDARERQEAQLQEGCRNVAALHSTATAAQRVRAVQRLQDYERDLRQLTAVR
ncbi:MAG: DUF6279 family lipoprotein [Variovorax sp.]